MSISTMDRLSEQRSALRKILKQLRIQYYDEIISILLLYLNNEIQESEIINNKILSDLLSIDENKASKILSVLGISELMIKSHEKNCYKFIPKDQLRSLLLDNLLKKSNEFVASFNILFQEQLNLSIHKELDIFEGLKLKNELLSSLSLLEPVYHSTNIPDFLASVPFNKH